MSGTPHAGMTVLLVEDEAADVCLVRMALSEVHVEADLRHVADGEEALAYLQQAAAGAADTPWPCLIILDLNMPRMNGRDFLRELRGLPGCASLPAVIFSTSEYDRDRQSCLDLGASDYVTKPVDIDDFIAAVRTISSRWTTLSA